MRGIPRPFLKSLEKGRGIPLTPASGPLAARNDFLDEVTDTLRTYAHSVNPTMTMMTIPTGHR